MGHAFTHQDPYVLPKIYNDDLPHQAMASNLVISVIYPYQAPGQATGKYMADIRSQAAYDWSGLHAESDLIKRHFYVA